MRVDHGALPAQVFELNVRGTKAAATLDTASPRHSFHPGLPSAIRFDEAIRLTEGQELRLEVLA